MHDTAFPDRPFGGSAHFYRPRAVMQGYFRFAALADQPVEPFVLEIGAAVMVAGAQQVFLDMHRLALWRFRRAGPTRG